MEVRRRAAIVVIVVLGVPAALVGVAAYHLHKWHQEGDPGWVARSAEAQAGERAATGLTDGQLELILRNTRPVTTAARSAANRCVVEPSAHLTLRRHVSCSRRVVQYLGVDVARAALEPAWTAALAGIGWVPATPGSAVYESAASRRLRVTIQWNERPTLPAVAAEQGDVTVDEPAVFRELYADHRYVVTVALRAAYYPDPPIPRPVPLTGR